MVTRFNFDRVKQNFARLKVELPVFIANDTQNFFAQNFTKQGFQDATLQAWSPRKKETKKSIGKNILIGTGKLRRAVQNSVREKTFDKIRLVVDGSSIPYAKVHNDGGHAGRGSGFEMPKRQFMGDSKELRRIQVRRIKSTIDKIWI